MGVKLQASSGGSVEIAAPVTASNYVLTAPAANGTILNDASSLAAAMLTGNVDVARLVSAFSGGNVSLAANGYQKLPSGLIMQWGLVVASAGNNTFSLPIAFPNSFLQIIVSDGSAVTGLQAFAMAAEPINTTSFSVFSSEPSGAENVRFFAIGY